jgi:hypothetical protein
MCGVPPQLHRHPGSDVLPPHRAYARWVRKRLAIESRIAQLRPDTKPASIEPALATGSGLDPLWLQFDEPLPADVLDAAASALARHTHVRFRAYGRRVDPTLPWLSGFEHIQHLVLDLPLATTFGPLENFTQLRSLSLGQTISKTVSLCVLRSLPRLEVLYVEAHDKDFDAVGDLRSLTRLSLRVPRVKSLEALRGLPNLEVVSINFGGIRELSPLATIPRLRGLELYQVRGLDTDDLGPIGECRSLEALSLGALRNVARLQALAHKPRETLRFLTLERLTGLSTLEDLTACRRLEEVGLYDARPADRRLDVLLRCPSLNRLVVGDPYPVDQFEILREAFGGETLLLRGEDVRGELADVKVRWRAPVHTQLDGLS